MLLWCNTLVVLVSWKPGFNLCPSQIQLWWCCQIFFQLFLFVVCFFLLGLGALTVTSVLGVPQERHWAVRGYVGELCAALSTAASPDKNWLAKQFTNTSKPCSEPLTDELLILSVTSKHPEWRLDHEMDVIVQYTIQLLSKNQWARFTNSCCFYSKQTKSCDSTRWNFHLYKC